MQLDNNLNTSNIIYGLHAVSTKLNYNSHQITEIVVFKQQDYSQRVQEIIIAAQKRNINLSYKRDEQLFNTAKKHQGVIALCTPDMVYDDKFLDKLIQDTPTPLVLLILENITDPHNLGACLRTAAAAKINGVIITKNNSVGVNSTVKKVACGGADIVPVIQVTNLARTLTKLKEQGVWLIGTSDKFSQPIYNLDLNNSIGWVLGAEGAGLKSLTTSMCDFHAHIPVAKSISSLNVSVAAGVCLFETLRQRDFT